MLDDAKSNLKLNNFDLLRWLAAFQVMITHACEHLGIGGKYVTPLLSLLSKFPGVPIFFLISGFLITASYERNHNLNQYYWNRFLRIYPALWVGFLVSILLIIEFAHLHHVGLKQILIWSLAQLSFFQFYNPNFLRGFGVGVLNGSLWTISVELQFYLAVPAIYFLVNKFRQRFRNENVVLYALFVIFLLINFYYINLHPELVKVNTNHLLLTNSMIFKIFSITLLPHLYIFIIGLLIRKHFTFFIGIFKNKLIYWLVLYLAASLFLSGYLQFGSNNPNPATLVILSGVVFSFAYTAPSIGQKILRGNDYSYGIYIYHMLIVNVLISLSLVGQIYDLAIAVCTTFFLAYLSWHLIEKPVLGFKRHPFRGV